ncbi:LOW QUALITY PROTEIN: hypothetical protein SPRG_17968 [Saprolegnia parasitica CBS 223.65]|uniref:Uncharacterized protein n=1 Tax=Saprolegnia parasitica (strain CBS 223.65) TaxID=695850 RepID=A0A067BQB8_SAPPC|nr:LOW QUALITY PROTEIN: hypothetical protein SPRG_17968 [Saprolegnia parasitica CBS 223.65]KDO16516.1 LOW QUALITY PROTEIN: hypothetical protein SPRG_17968 [Saprolegnia parasitica CBS 223.65]|eukprot:XP_012212777.1 LOW QUALITY PROTEIN: hypothetical protein SPRG_17968 [Saprolegnia parasitica CBS 223.65]
MQANKKQKALTDANMYPDTDTQFAATHHAAIEQQKQMKLLSYADQSDDEGEDNAGRPRSKYLVGLLQLHCTYYVPCLRPVSMQRQINCDTDSMKENGASS